jgi:serine/threonine-protein kinase
MKPPEMALAGNGRHQVAAKLESGSSEVPLAPDVHRGACQRLAWVALCYAIGYAVVFGYYWSQVFTHHALRPDLFNNVVAAAAVGLGLVVYVRAKRCVPTLQPTCETGCRSVPVVSYARLASVFEVAAALGMVAGWGWGWEQDLAVKVLGAGSSVGIETANLQADFVDRLAEGHARIFEFFGVTWVGVWVIFFPFLVPSEPRESVWTSLLAASTVPFVLLASLLAHGIPDAARPWVPEYLGNMIIPTYICAGFAVIASRVVYRLTHELSKARRMGSYELVERLGAGGMGEVWRAKHRMLARPGAIKIIRPEALGAGNHEQTATALRRFEREAQATAALRSPHTVDLYDFGITDEGSFYYVMELLDGVDLKSLVEKHGPVPVKRASFVLRQICASIAEAHTRGLIHRDIKPANIFVCRHGLEYDFVKVLDFGLVKRADESDDVGSQLTAAGTAPGTPMFMSPEMARGDDSVDGRADIYALGCVAYWLVTGQFVFDGDSPMDVIVRHIRDDPVPPSARTELDIPGDFDRVVLDCLEKDPSKRPQTAEELSRRFDECEGRAGRWTHDLAAKWWTLHVPPARTGLGEVAFDDAAGAREVRPAETVPRA